MTMPYKLYSLPNTNTRVLAFGMMYTFDHAATNIRIDNVTVSLAKPWFKEAMAAAANADIIVGVLHIGPTDPDRKVVYEAVRKYVIALIVGLF